MSALSEHLQRLFNWLETLGPLPTPVGEVLLIEVPRSVGVDSRGRLLISEDMIQSPTEYASRFDDLLNANLSWIHMTCYGLWKGSSIVGIDLPRSVLEDSVSRRTPVNYAGPENRAKEHGWDANESLALPVSESLP